MAIQKNNTDIAASMLEDYLVRIGCVAKTRQSLEDMYLISTDINSDIPVSWSGAKPQDLNFQWDVKILLDNDGLQKTDDLGVLHYCSVGPGLASMGVRIKLPNLLA